MEPVRRRLSEEQHRQDLGSSIALGQSLCMLAPSPRGSDEPISWMEDRPLAPVVDLQLQIRTVMLHWHGTADGEFLSSVLEALKSRPRTSLAPVVRMLDAVAMLDQAKLLC